MSHDDLPDREGAGRAGAQSAAEQAAAERIGAEQSAAEQAAAERALGMALAGAHAEGPAAGEDPRMGLSGVGWEPPSGELSYEDWVSQGHWLGSVNRCSRWWIGDWVRFGTAKYGEKYKRASELTGYDEHSLRNMVYVASRFPKMSRRRDKLSFSHHAELAPLPVEERERWLNRAESERLSVASLREMLRTGPKELTSGDGEGSDPGQDAAGELDGDGDSDGIGIVSCPHCGHRFVPETEDHEQPEPLLHSGPEPVRKRGPEPVAQGL